MTTRLSKHQCTTMLLALSLVSSAVAFEDKYEPDNLVKQATEISLSDVQQHTLHTLKDVDWFKLNVQPHLTYEIAVEGVGRDLDVVLEIYNDDGTRLIEEIDVLEKGEGEFTTIKSSSEKVYYIKIRDIAKPLKEGNCRLNMQYELHIKAIGAALPWSVKGIVTDKLSGKPIEGVMVMNHCNRPTFSNSQGEYRLNSCNLPNGTYALTISKPGYKTLSCHFPATGLTLITRHIVLIPTFESYDNQIIAKTDHKLQASKEVYSKGDELEVELPLFLLPEGDCVRYFLAMQYPEPDNRLFFIEHFIRGFNQLREVKSNIIPHWIGVKSGAESLKVIKMSVEDMPLGEYKLYLLRMPGYVEDPFNHLNLGELNVTTFKVE
jgi:hypothetical protein